MATLQSDLKKLLPNTRKNGRLAPAADRDPIPAGQGKGLRTAAVAKSSSSAGGVAWPLTETARTVTQHSDGTHDYYVAVSSTVVDADGTEGQINWLQPGSPNITVI